LRPAPDWRIIARTPKLLTPSCVDLKVNFQGFGAQERAGRSTRYQWLATKWDSKFSDGFPGDTLADCPTSRARFPHAAAVWLSAGLLGPASPNPPDAIDTSN